MTTRSKGVTTIRTYESKILPVGSGAHIYVPKEFLGHTAEVRIKGKWFLCKGCSEIIVGKGNFSPDPELCIHCYREKKAMQEGKCISCGGPNPIKENWAQCQKCWDAGVKANDEWNKKYGKPMIDEEEYFKRHKEEEEPKKK